MLASNDAQLECMTLRNQELTSKLRDSMVTGSYFSVNTNMKNAQNSFNNKYSSLGQMPGGNYRSVKAINIVLEWKLMEHSIHMIGWEWQHRTWHRRRVQMNHGTAQINKSG